jgi:hypothetical protein
MKVQYNAIYTWLLSIRKKVVDVVKVVGFRNSLYIPTPLTQFVRTHNNYNLHNLVLGRIYLVSLGAIMGSIAVTIALLFLHSQRSNQCRSTPTGGVRAKMSNCNEVSTPHAGQNPGQSIVARPITRCIHVGYNNLSSVYLTEVCDFSCKNSDYGKTCRIDSQRVKHRDLKNLPQQSRINDLRRVYDARHHKYNLHQMGVKRR